MTNSEIVEIVYKRYNLRQLITNMISSSYKDQTHDDMEQYIYEYLLQYDNIKLNKIFNGNKLRNFISQIIKNQRNTFSSAYTKCRLITTNEVYFDEMKYLEDEYDFKCEIIVHYVVLNMELDDYDYSNEMLDEILDRIYAFSLFHKYYLSAHYNGKRWVQTFTYKKLTKNFKIKKSRPVISNYIKYVKNDIIAWWNMYGKYLDEKYLEIK